MADRRLVRTVEIGGNGLRHEFVIERSAAGRPGGIVTITISGPDTLQELSVVVDDLNLLQPALDWANAVNVRQQADPRERPWNPELTASIDRERAEAERLRALLRRIRGMCRAGEWIAGDGLGRYIDAGLDR